MSLSRREFLQFLAAASTGAALSACERKSFGVANAQGDLYSVPTFGHVSLLHIGDLHAQLQPLYFREADVNVGRRAASVGETLLKQYHIPASGIDAYALTHMDFVQAAKLYGKMGGLAYVATLIRTLRDQRAGRCLLLDSGDTWQGSATSLWTHAQDMAGAAELLGVDAMTGHWEFSFGERRVQEIVTGFGTRTRFLAQNVLEREGATPVFAPYMRRDLNGVPVAVIGQASAFAPTTPRFTLDNWRFGFEEERLQQIVDQATAEGARLVVLLSHNGIEADRKLVSRVRGIDVVLSGHGHDALPAPLVVGSGDRRCLIVSSGANGKFVSVLDVEMRNGRLYDYRYRLLPVIANFIAPEPRMSAYIEKVRLPFKPILNEALAVTDTLLYRRAALASSFDELLLRAMRTAYDAPIAMFPGYRWGATLLPGDTIRYEDLLDHTAVPGAGTTVDLRRGEEIKDVLEQAADRLFNPDPYAREGGDMLRTTGLRFTIDPSAEFGARIGELMLADGTTIEPQKTYRVAAWALTGNEDGRTLSEIAADFLRGEKIVRVGEVYLPTLKQQQQAPLNRQA